MVLVSSPRYELPDLFTWTGYSRLARVGQAASDLRGGSPRRGLGRHPAVIRAYELGGASRGRMLSECIATSINRHQKRTFQWSYWSLLELNDWDRESAVIHIHFIFIYFIFYFIFFHLLIALSLLLLFSFLKTPKVTRAGIRWIMHIHLASLLMSVKGTTSEDLRSLLLLLSPDFHFYNLFWLVNPSFKIKKQVN